MFFKKKISPPQTPQHTEDKEGAESPPAYNAESVFGGIAWYRAQYRRTMKLALGLVLTLIAAIAVIAVLVLTRPTPRYFAATPDLRLAPLIPLDKPVLTQQGLLNWVTETISNAVSLDFLEWREKLTRSREHFEEAAFASFVDSLNSSGVLDMIRDNAFTAAEAQAIRSEILLAAQNIIGTIKTESATIVRAIVGLKESNAAMLKGQAAASEAMKTEDLYGKASQPSGLCGASSVGAGLQLGAQAATEVRGAMRDKQREYGSRAGARPVEFLDRIVSDEHPDAKAMTDALYPLKDTLTEDQVAEAHEAIKTLTNPRPLPVVTDAQKETPAGQTYAAARLIHEGRLAVVTETLNNHVVSHAPTLPDEVASWAQNQWSEAGGSGTPPGLVNGKLSEAGLFKLLSQMRISNPNWFVQVTGATEAGLLRELVMMQALQLELTRKNNELLDRLTVTASMDFLTRMEGTDGKAMTDLYSRMVGAQQ